MELTDLDLDVIESYFNQTLSENDKKSFEQRLKTDQNFRRAVNEFQATSAVLNTVRQREQKDFLKSVDATMPPVATPVRTFNFNWRAIAAVGLLLIAAGIWQFFGDTGSGVKLKSSVAGYFEAYPSLNTTRGVEEKDKKATAFAAYDAQKYKSAVNLFENAFIEKPDTMLLFYKGIAELAGGEAAKAEKDLTQLQTSSIVPQQAVFFYLGLAAAENGQSEKAISHQA